MENIDAEYLCTICEIILLTSCGKEKRCDEHKQTLQYHQSCKSKKTRVNHALNRIA